MADRFCATCRHWDTEPHPESRGLDAADQVRRCTRVFHWMDATEWRKDEAGQTVRALTPEAKRTHAFVADASYWRADLLTRASFGCVMHERKEVATDG